MNRQLIVPNIAFLKLAQLIKVTFTQFSVLEKMSQNPMLQICPEIYELRHTIKCFRQPNQLRSIHFSPVRVSFQIADHHPNQQLVGSLILNVGHDPDQVQ